MSQREAGGSEWGWGETWRLKQKVTFEGGGAAIQGMERPLKSGRQGDSPLEPSGHKPADTLIWGQGNPLGTLDLQDCTTNQCCFKPLSLCSLFQQQQEAQSWKHWLESGVGGTQDLLAWPWSSDLPPVLGAKSARASALPSITGTKSQSGSGAFAGKRPQGGFHPPPHRPTFPSWPLPQAPSQWNWGCGRGSGSQE